MPDSRRYRLHAIDGRPLPIALRYDEERCVGEEFDRLDARHLTFPGGFRKRRRTPELLVTHSADVLEIAPVAPEAPVGRVEQHFGARAWQFRAVEPSETPVSA